MTRPKAGWMTTLVLPLLLAASATALERGIQGVSEAQMQRERPRRWAVLIGVDRYDDEYGIGNLRHCSSDMKLLYKVLTGPGGGFRPEQVLLMTSDAEDENRRPTFSNILRMVPRWLRDAKKEDDVLLAFSGHGIEQDGKAYMLPSGAVKGHLALSAVSLSLIQEWMDNCRAERKILVIDACHAGAGKAPSQMSPDFWTDMQRGKGFVRLASCGPKQKSNEDEALGHGVFTYYLSQGLTGRADQNGDGRVDTDELYKYAYDRVTQWAREAGVEQDPLREGSGQGVMTLAYVTPRQASLPELAREPERKPPLPPDSTPTARFRADGFLEPPDTLVLRSGDKLEGQILHKDATWTTVKLATGETRRLPSQEVASVETPTVALTLHGGEQVVGTISARMGTKLMILVPEGGRRFIDVASVTRTEVVELPEKAAEPEAPTGEPARLGIKSAAAAELGVPLDLDPVKKALERKFGEVQDVPNGLFIPRLGSGGGAAWVFADGTVIAADRRDLSASTQLAKIQNEWGAVAREIAGVTAALDAAGLFDTFTVKADFFTPKADQYQRLLIIGERINEIDWVLRWPDARPYWARVVVAADTEMAFLYGASSLALDGEVEEFRGRARTFNIGRITFGEHTVRGTIHGENRRVLFEASFPDPNGRIALQDKANRSVATRECFSGDIAALTRLLAEKTAGR